MTNDTAETMNTLLADWHRWAIGYKYVGGIGSSPMYRQVKPSRGWDTVDEIIDSDVHHGQMEAIDHAIMALADVHRTALQIQARNLHTGVSVWVSARLPQDVEARAVLLASAREELLQRLQDMGVM